MATQAQIIANRANSQKSTGPSTPDGKAKSCRNHLSHGFASNTRFIKGENPEEFYALLNDLRFEHQPATTTEQILVEKLAHNQWISLRAGRFQAETLQREVEFVTRFQRFPHDFALLVRYQTTADRAFHKALADLLKLQKERKKSEIGFESKNTVEPVNRPAESAESTEKPPVVIQKPVPEAPVTPDPASIAEELDWVMNASIEEMRASGF